MTAHEPKVTAVIVTYHSRGEVGDALDALHEAHRQGLADAVVVDNNSSDGTADFVAEHYPWVSLVRSQENLGYGRGCNRGFEEVSTPYVLILNPDAVLDVEALETLVELMEENAQVGIASPAIIEGDTIQNAGLMTTPSSLLRGALGFGLPMPESRPIPPGGPSFRTSWVCGAIMLIRSDLFRTLGGFDPRFFLYFEETDLCRRATRHGVEIWACGAAVARHVGGSSASTTGKALESSCIAEHFYPSRFYYLVKHFGWVQGVGAELSVRAAQRLRRVRHRLAGRQVGSAADQRPFRFPPHPGERE